MTLKTHHWLLAAALALSTTGSASAAMISGSMAFTASFPAGSPYETVSGVVSYSFDNAANILNAANGSTANGAPVQVSFSGLTLPGDWTPVLGYFKSFSPIPGVVLTDVLSIGHVLNGTNAVAGTDDWRIAFNDVSTGATFREFTYTLAGSTVLFQTFAGTATAVPEPGTFALAALGLLGVLGARGRRRRAAGPEAIAR